MTIKIFVLVFRNVKEPGVISGKGQLKWKFQSMQYIYIASELKHFFKGRVSDLMPFFINIEQH